MNREKLKNIIEAALMVAHQPLNLHRIQELFENEQERPGSSDIRAAIEQLQQEYDGRGIELKEIASGFRIQARVEYCGWLNRLFEEKSPRYSRALIETLAIIVYRQPITRGEIENIRGVGVSSAIIKTLHERKWIKVVGHRDIPGKPELLATTRQFLDYFNLKKLTELSVLAESKDAGNIDADLFEDPPEEAADKTGLPNPEENKKVLTSDDSAGNGEPLQPSAEVKTIPLAN